MNVFELETYLADHSAIDGPEAREIVRRFSAGENIVLPEAITTAGVDARNALVAALAAAQAVTEPAAALPAPAASTSPSGMTPEARKTVLQAIAPEPQFAATVEWLAGAPDVSLEDASGILRRAKDEAAVALSARGWSPDYRTIAERAAEFSQEFGPMTSMPMIDGASRKEAVKAGWSKAVKAAQEPGGTLIVGGR